MFSLQQQVNAQLVAPALSQQFLAPATPLSSFADDITVNCDMLSTANGLPIRAIVWDDGSEATYGLGIGQVHVYLQDYAGYTYKYDFQGAHADVVLGDDPNNPGVNYYMAIAYVDGNYHQVVSYYLLSGVGPPGFTATPAAPTQQLGIAFNNPLFDSEALPHIDITPDPPTPGGLPLMHRFVATFCDNGSVYYAAGDVTGGLSPAVSVANGKQPDVSCETDIVTGDRYANIVYLSPATSNVNLMLTRVALGTGTSTSSILDINNTNLRHFFLPRIESMNLLDPANPGVEWQVVSSVVDYPAGNWAIYGYNNVAGKRWLSSYFPTSSVDGKASAVAAGTGITMGNFIGNTQYTTGFFPRQVQRLYSRSVDAFTGIETKPCYQISNSTVYDVPTYAESDAAKSLAISNCSNSGRFTLSVWYDGNLNMFQKLSTSNTVQFKTTGVEDIANGETGKLYPNPATDYIRLSETGNYKIYDMQGRLVMNGEKKAATETINIEKLPTGNYMVQVQTQAGIMNYNFVKL